MTIPTTWTLSRDGKSLTPNRPTIPTRCHVCRAAEVCYVRADGRGVCQTCMTVGKVAALVQGVLF